MAINDEKIISEVQSAPLISGLTDRKIKIKMYTRMGKSRRRPTVCIGCVVRLASPRKTPDTMANEVFLFFDCIAPKTKPSDMNVKKNQGPYSYPPPINSPCRKGLS